MPDRPLVPLVSAFEDRRVGVVYTLLLLLTLGRWFQAGGRPAPLFVLVALPAGVATHLLEHRHAGVRLLGLAIVALLLLVVESPLVATGGDGRLLSGVVGFLLGYLLSVLEHARHDDAVAP